VFCKCVAPVPPCEEKTDRAMQCVAVRCSALQYVAVRCSVFFYCAMSNLRLVPHCGKEPESVMQSARTSQLVKKIGNQNQSIQPVHDKMRLEMLVEMQIEILDGRSSGFFSNEPFEKRPAMTIEDFGSWMCMPVWYRLILIPDFLYSLRCLWRQHHTLYLWHRLVLIPDVLDGHRRSLV